MTRITRVLAAVVGALALTLTAGAVMSSASAASSLPSCSAGLTGLKLDKEPAVGDVVSDGTLTVTITEVKLKLDDSGDVVGFKFSSNIPVVEVYVKGGTGFLRYSGDRLFSDFLFAPIKADGTHHAVSFALFCY